MLQFQVMYLSGHNTPLRVGWVAGPATLERQGPLLSLWANELERQGVELRVFCPRGTSVALLHLPPEAIDRYGISRRLALTRSQCPTLIESAQAANVDVLHALDDSVGTLTAVTGDRLRTPYFVNCCRLGERVSLPHRERHLAAILAAGEPILSDLRKRRVAKEEKLHLFRPGVLTEADPKRLDFTDRRAMILADVNGARNPVAEAVLKSFATLRNEGRGALFFLLHSARHERFLRRRAETLELQAELTFLAAEANPRAMHAAQSADVYVAASGRRELDFGGLLAMAAGVPVLSVRNRNSDFFNDGMTTSFFPAGDPGPLSKLLIDVLDSPAWAQAQAKSALQYLRVYHNLIRGMSDLARLYREAVEVAKIQQPVEA